MDWLNLTTIIILSYLIGSIPTGYILVKLVKGIDIRTIGSGGTGATNVKRVLGTKYFVIVMLIDILKGLIPLLILKYLNYVPAMLNGMDILCIITGIFLVIGHSKSIYLKFTGGKSVATSLGVLAGMCWQVALSAFLIWLLVVTLTKFVSLGSIIAAIATPILMLYFGQPISYIIFTLVCSLYVAFYLHKNNIKRLIEGSENKITFKEEKV